MHPTLPKLLRLSFPFGYGRFWASFVLGLISIASAFNADILASGDLHL